MAARRSLIFVPATRPDRFEKALAAKSDLVCVDLEDSVPPGSKQDGRIVAVSWLCDGGQGPERVVRINSLKTVDGLRDLTAIAEATPAGGVVLLPKVDGPDELAIAEAILVESGSDARLGALVESVDGLEHVQAIATASSRLEFLLFGAVDLAAELGCDLDQASLMYARSRMVHAARRAGVAAFDVPALDFRNLQALEEEARAARSLGFTGKAVLHPDNVPVVNAVFSPTPKEVAQARRVIDAFAASSTGLVVIDGKLVEKPVLRKMEQILAAAAAGAE